MMTRILYGDQVAHILKKQVQKNKFTSIRLKLLELDCKINQYMFHFEHSWYFHFTSFHSSNAKISI